MIVVAGEALFDLVLEPSGSIAAHPGGGPFNTARTLGRLGQPVAFLGRVSGDGFGRRLLRMLEDDGVGLDSLVRTDDSTTLALAEIDGAGVAGYRFYVSETSAPGLTPRAARKALPDAVEALHVGTLGITLEPTAVALETLVDECSDTTLVMLDPNCRPAAMTDPGAYRARLARLLGRADLVKVSEEDLEWLEPGADPLDIARGLLAAGPAAVLLTRGAAGAVALTASEETEVTAPQVRVLDTIGAGDAFGGGVLAWWRRAGLGRDGLADHASVVEATRFGCLVAARTCERAGASPPRLVELGLAG